jgi:hypothetical protein
MSIQYYYEKHANEHCGNYINLIFSGVINEDVHNLPEEKTYKGDKETPQKGAQGAVEKKSPLFQVRASKEQKDDTPHTHKEPDEEYDVIPVTLYDLICQRYSAPEKLILLNDFPAEQFSDKEKCAVPCESPCKSPEHDLVQVHVTKFGKDASKQDRCLTLEKGADKYGDIAILGNVIFHDLHSI